MSVYLDHNAAGPVHPEVAEAVRPFLDGNYGNPSAPYALGREARRALEGARAQVAALLHAEPRRVIFTGGGTEANNLAISGAFFSRRDASRRHLVTTAVEHPAVLQTCRWLAARHGAELTEVGVEPDGRVLPEAVTAALRPDTLLVAVMHANNETGAVQPVEQVGERLRGLGVLFHVDGVQAVGRLPVDMQAIGCDSYAISAHKFGGLKGCGALAIAPAAGIGAILQGGHQEAGLRAGTENVPGAVAMGKAAEVAARDLDANSAHALRLRGVFDRLAGSLRTCWINGPRDLRLPNTTNLCCLNADAMSVVLALSSMGIFVGTGSACASSVQRPSHVLKAMGLSDQAAFCSIRISTGPGTRLEEAECVAATLAEVVERVRLVTDPDAIGQCDETCPCHLEPSP